APEVLALVRRLGGRVEVTPDPRAAATGADVLYTDVWTSMGQEAEQARRREVFREYQLSDALVRCARPTAVVMHCLPAHRGEEIIPVRDKALRTGAASVHIVDLREEFVRDFVFPMLRANAVYEGGYLLGTSIARPLIARAQVEVALKEGADAVAHGATGKGND